MNRWTMTTSTALRTAAFGAALATTSAVLVAGGWPAGAATPVTAQLIGGTEVVSTLSRQLDVRVTNPGALKGNTNYVNSVIVVPQLPPNTATPLMSVTSGSA